MGETIAKIKVSNLMNLKWEEIEVLADTGATYTSLPGKVLDELGIEREEKIKLELANGRIIERDLGNALLKVDGRLRANPVVFGETNDSNILGLITLESCALTVDTINRKLIPLPKIHHFILKELASW